MGMADLYLAAYDAAYRAICHYCLDTYPNDHKGGLYSYVRNNPKDVTLQQMWNRYQDAWDGYIAIRAKELENGNG